MNRDQILGLIKSRAIKFGYANPQQIDFLYSRLKKFDQNEVLHGLIMIFTRGESSLRDSAAQELAGKLLTKLQIKGDIDLCETLTYSLSQYELSVEEFPCYLAGLFGLEQVRSALNEIAKTKLTETELRALNTMRFWLKLPEKS